MVAAVGFDDFEPYDGCLDALEPKGALDDFVVVSWANDVGLWEQLGLKTDERFVIFSDVVPRLIP